MYYIRHRLIITFIYWLG